MDRKRVLWYLVVPTIVGSFVGFLRAKIEDCDAKGGVIVVGIAVFQCVVPVKGVNYG